MYKILCLTSGQYVHLARLYKQSYYFDWTGISSDFLGRILVGFDTGLLLFRDEESAEWFKRRRLTYNPLRQNKKKLTFMQSIFEASSIDHWKTNKLEFEIIEELDDVVTYVV